MTLSRTAAAFALLAATSALAACSSTTGSEPSQSPSVTESTSSAADVVTSPPVTETPSPSESTSASPTPTKTPTKSPTSSATPRPDDVPFVTTCTNLTTRIIPGGAVRGAEIAAVQYTNDGSDACTITGTPKLVLLKNGKKIGTPSQPSGKPAKTFTLQPGDVGESLVRDFSTCNAPLAENGRVTVPGRTEDDATTVVRPVKLRACILRVDPVGAPA